MMEKKKNIKDRRVFLSVLVNGIEELLLFCVSVLACARCKEKSMRALRDSLSRIRAL